MNKLNKTGGALRRTACALGLAAAAVLAGCASPTGLPAGSTPANAIAALGQPTGQYPLPNGGQRLQYSQGPAGRHVWNADYDAGGRLVSVRDAMSYDSFNTLVMGQSTRDDVLRLMGKPGLVEHVYSFKGDVWTYRFNDMNNARLVSVHIDTANIVQRIVYTDEFIGRDRADR